METILKTVKMVGSHTEKKNYSIQRRPGKKMLFCRPPEKRVPAGQGGVFGKGNPFLGDCLILREKKTVQKKLKKGVRKAGLRGPIGFDTKKKGVTSGRLGGKNQNKAWTKTGKKQKAEQKERVGLKSKELNKKNFETNQQGGKKKKKRNPQGKTSKVGRKNREGAEGRMPFGNEAGNEGLGRFKRQKNSDNR